ncbi:MAG: hypothetical protein OXB87_02135, partial [Hyphomicrobiales bacterium]|nr:hypothetical protein [Hyphomicrobiales bacterium]
HLPPNLGADESRPKLFQIDERAYHPTRQEQEKISSPLCAILCLYLFRSHVSPSDTICYCVLKQPKDKTSDNQTEYESHCSHPFLFRSLNKDEDDATSGERTKIIAPIASQSTSPNLKRNPMQVQTKSIMCQSSFFGFRQNFRLRLGGWAAYSREIASLP